MKEKLLVVFRSAHGYVRRYVEIIGNALGCDAVPADKLKPEMLMGYDKILYIGSVRGDEIVGIKKFSEYFDLIYKKLVVCAVGLTPFRSYMPGHIKDTSITVTYEKFIPVFYAQGGFDMSELSRAERFTVSMRCRQIKMSGAVNENDKCFIDAAEHPLDEVKQENIQPLIDYLDGKPVDAALYSPPEITDPEEEKKYFEELEAATQTPEDKKRSIKKKLKKSLKAPDVPASDEQAEQPTAVEEPAAQTDEPTSEDK